MKLSLVPIPIILTWISRVFLFLILLFEVFQHNILVAIGALAALVLSLLPVYVFKGYSHTLPRSVELAVTISLIIHVFGVTFDFYNDVAYWWWDQVAHFFGTAVIGFLAFEFIFAINYTGKVNMSNFMMGVFIFSIAMAIGALWEIAEFYFDMIFDTHSLGDLYDTLQDLQFDAVGGLLAAIWGFYYQRRFEKRIDRDNIKPGEVDISNLECKKCFDVESGK